jgi:hypothetical protein
VPQGHEVAAVGLAHRRGRVVSGGQGVGQLLGQLVQPGAQGVHLVLQVDDPLDPGQVHAVLLGQPLNLAQQHDVAHRVPPAAPGRASRGHEAEPVVTAERLRVQAGELRGHGDHEERGVLVRAGREGETGGVHAVLPLLSSRAFSSARGSCLTVAAA